jgi:formylglycine-generating enzyme required for sulfatase activity
MMQIPAGQFLMGSPDTELGRSDAEGPQHEVAVPLFFMAKYPVTQAQWQVVAAMPQVKRELEAEPSSFKGNDRPVEQVNWYDAVEFCARLSAHTGLTYRLPTEAEWEYACRAGTTTPFHFGKLIDSEFANYKHLGKTKYRPYSEIFDLDAEIGAEYTGIQNYVDSVIPGVYQARVIGEYRSQTTNVNLFGSSNNFGLCDMHGNVFEWCYDYWHKTYQKAPKDGSAWLSSERNSLRVIRGGSWKSLSEDCRSGFRTNDYPNDQFNGLGFRVVCSGSKSPQV